MSSKEDVVLFDHVSKVYAMGARLSAREAVIRVGRRMVGRSAAPTPTHTALKDVDFAVQEGDAMGLVGRNGAGKSTILKIVSRITSPTVGRAMTRGRVASLLEIGTGFHPELSGRENIFLNGAILGMTRRDIGRRFDEIVEFSAVERFLDTPVKRFSSGMYLRLAFAVAAHLEPDILVVDEVLAVGDAEFQRKCLNRMAEAEKEGRTVLFVSHDLESLARLCPYSMWIDAGEVRGAGPTPEVIQNYLGSSGLGQAHNSWSASAGVLTVHRMAVSPTGSLNASGAVLQSQGFEVTINFELTEVVPALDIAVYVSSSSGTRLLDELLSEDQDFKFGVGRYRVLVEVPPILMGGEYIAGVWFGSRYETILDQPNAVPFTIEREGPGHRSSRQLDLRLPFAITPLTADGGADNYM